MEALTAWEQESASTTPIATKPPAAASATEPTAPATDTEGDQTSQAKPDEGTPAVKDQQLPDKSDKPTETTKETTKYAKAQGRMAKTWEEINREKDLVRTTSEALKQRQADLDSKEQALAAREAKLSQPKYKPEDYEAYAAKLEAEATQQEEAGDFTKADRLSYDAGKAREYAKQLRDNPPKADPTEAQQKAQYQAQQKEWWGKAAVDFPNVVKEGSPERTALLSLLQSEPAIVNDPKGMYYASRLVTAETLSARVPQLVKDLEAATARVKELEQLTAIPTDGSVALSNNGPKSFEQMTPAEQLAQLESEARAMSS